MISTDKLNLLGVHSGHDFCATAAERLTQGSLRGADSAGTEVSPFRTEWTGTRNLAHALEMARDGWQDGANSISKALDSLPAGVEVLPDWSLDVHGAFPCIPEFLSGTPDCMWRLERTGV
jgi:hypothetical protein